MNKLLLQKIEELTLYLIQKDKEITSLNEEICKSKLTFENLLKKIDKIEQKMN
jgi:hypothetical protein